MKIVKNVTFFLLVVSYSGALHAMQQDAHENNKEVALLLDIDDVLVGKNKVGYPDYALLVTNVAVRNPRILTAVPHVTAITEYAENLENTINGASNIVREMLSYFKTKGYGDLSHHESRILELSQKPYPVKAMFEHIIRLKKEGHPIVLATNEDWQQLKICMAKMREHGVDLNMLVDGIITTRVHHVPAPEGTEPFYKLHPQDPNDKTYVVRSLEDYKPREAYFKVAEAVIKHVAPMSKRVIHTDDRDENVQAAKRAGHDGIWFKLPAPTVHQTPSEDLEKTITQWASDIEEKRKASAKQ
jgi:FMN phosphatase YigB (HAD superfamily)